MEYFVKKCFICNNKNRRYMKKIATTLSLIVCFSAFGFAQEANEDSNCYYKWAKKFDERGAEEVPDGVYTDVIISFRIGPDAECYNGKCEVKGGKVIAMYMKLEDGSYEQIKKKPKYDNVPMAITNGISSPYLTIDGELINVIFVKKMKPKKAAFQKAIDPSED